IPHGSTSNSSFSTCSKISYDDATIMRCCRVFHALLNARLLGKLYLIVHSVMLKLLLLMFLLCTYNNSGGQLAKHSSFAGGNYGNPFFAPVNTETIEAFMNRVSYQGVVDKDFMNNVNQKKEVIQQQKVVEGEKNDDSEDRFESYNDKPKYVDDDDDDDKDAEKVDKEEGGKVGSLETRIEEMQTPIPTKHRSLWTILSSDKNITQELTKTVPFPTTTTSNTPHTKRQISNKYSNLAGALRRICRRQGDDDIHSYHDDRQEDSKHSAKDSITYLSKQQQQQEWDAWVKEIVIDKDEVILEDETPELITELQEVNKHVPTIFDYKRMKAALNDALSNQFKNAEEYAYHLNKQQTSWRIK
nr:hypothetical protein [Tanacetum cinerariifolium]